MSVISTFKLVHKLRETYLCRCKFWVTCGAKSCYHYEPHAPHTEKCILFSPIKWCSCAEGFVYCVPMNEIDANYDCDPNLAFKAKMDAKDRRHRKKGRNTEGRLYHNGLEVTYHGQRGSYDDNDI